MEVFVCFLFKLSLKKKGFNVADSTTVPVPIMRELFLLMTKRFLKLTVKCLLLRCVEYRNVTPVSKLSLFISNQFFTRTLYILDDLVIGLCRKSFFTWLLALFFNAAASGNIGQLFCRLWCERVYLCSHCQSSCGFYPTPRNVQTQAESLEDLFGLLHTYSLGEQGKRSSLALFILTKPSSCLHSTVQMCVSLRCNWVGQSVWWRESIHPGSLNFSPLLNGEVILHGVWSARRGRMKIICAQEMNHGMLAVWGKHPLIHDPELWVGWRQTGYVHVSSLLGQDCHHL